METPPRNPKSEAPSVSMPPVLFAKMAHCFYGDGPRYWQTTEVEQVEEPRVIKRDGFGHMGTPPVQLTPHPMGGGGAGLPQGIEVPAYPKSWRRKVGETVEGDLVNDPVPAAKE